MSSFAAPSSHSPRRWERVDGGIRVQTPRATFEVLAERPGVFRMGVSLDGLPLAPATPMLVESNAVGIEPTIIDEDVWVGIETAAGALLVDPASGAWTLRDSHGDTLIRPLAAVADAPTFERGILTLSAGWRRDTPIVAYGCGNGQLTLRHASAAPRVGNGLGVTSWMWCPDGYTVLAASADAQRPPGWRGDTPRARVLWEFPGRSGYLYLAPAPTLKDAARIHGELTGFAPVPPRWTFGYLQSRWGWKDAAELEQVFGEFRRRRIPVDAFILDFEWYTREPDYEVPPAGVSQFPDFDVNPAFFSDPKALLESFHRRGLKLVAIRKPRLGDAVALRRAREQEWTLLPADAAPATDVRPGPTKPTASGSHENVTEIPDARKWNVRELDFRLPEVRAWYAERMRPLLELGFDAWWNDEGESSYLTYHYWNEAERALAEVVRPGQRFWSLNRAVTPGLQRLGATAWTGDTYGTWEALAATPTHLLNWSLAGMPYGGCDIGGFRNEVSPDLFVRWIQAGVFFPMMRAHTSNEWTPRFPWLFGSDAEAALKRAIELRYRLIPYYYSLAHVAYREGLPLMRPLVMEFPEDPLVADLASQWLVGERVMAAPLLAPGNERSVYLPAKRWYQFGGTDGLDGGRVIGVRATLDDIPVFVRAGTLLPIGPVIQSTSELPGGSLELQVYPGEDAVFTLFEDDGTTNDYETGRLRTIEFQWDDSARVLSWAPSGNFDGLDVFRCMRVRVMQENVAVSDEVDLAAAGDVKFSAL